MLHLLIGFGLIVGGVSALIGALFLLYQISRFYYAVEIIGLVIAAPAALVLLALALGEAVTGSQPHPPNWLIWVCIAGFAAYCSTYPLCAYYYALGGKD